MAEDPSHGGEGCRQEPGDVPEVQPLMAEIHGLLELLRIDAAEADPILGSELGKAAPVLQMLDEKPEPATLGQAGIGVGYAWVREVGVGGSHLNQ